LLGFRSKDRVKETADLFSCQEGLRETGLRARLGFYWAISGSFQISLIKDN